MRPLEKSSKRCNVRHVDRRTLRKRNMPIKWPHRPLIKKSELRVGTRKASADVYAVTMLHARDSFADRFNYPRSVRPRRIRQGRLSRIDSRADVGIHRVDASRLDAHHHLALFRFRIGHFFKTQDFGSSKLLYANGSHLSP